jgi:hypothetical protein
MRIINFGQMVSLEHGTQIAHQITVELPSGQRHQVLTDDSTVQQLVDLISGGTEQARTVPQHKTLEEVLDQESDVGDMFGGDLDPGELRDLDESHEPEVVMGALSGMSPVYETPSGGLGRPQQREAKRLPVDSDGFLVPVRAKTVPRDEMGYPIVPHRTADVPNTPDDDGEGDGYQI